MFEKVYRQLRQKRDSEGWQKLTWPNAKKSDTNKEKKYKPLFPVIQPTLTQNPQLGNSMTVILEKIIYYQDSYLSS